MDFKTFKKKLSIHGADFHKWDGVNPSDAENFMKTSGKAQALYKEAQDLDKALDMVVPAAIDETAIIKKAQAQIEEGIVTSFSPLSHQNSEIKTAAGALIACAAAIILVHSMGMELDQMKPPAAIDTAQVDSFVDELYIMLDEQSQADMLFAYLDHSDNNGSNQEEIDEFLDDVLEEPEPDIWDMFDDNQG